MTKVTVERCLWSESDPGGNHHLCSDLPLFDKEVSWPTENGMETGTVPLCLRHSLQVDEEGIGKR